MKSLLGKLGVVLVVILISILITLNVSAQEIGRYQAVAMPKVQGDADHVLIIDTKEGHLWVYDRFPTVLNTDGSVRFKGAIQIIYQGKVKPGKKMMDYIEKVGGD